jgi:uncharacterized membrane protein YeaQ/YmgE (transglycosylase-associated protein family)
MDILIAVVVGFVAGVLASGKVKAKIEALKAKYRG